MSRKKYSVNFPLVRLAFNVGKALRAIPDLHDAGEKGLIFDRIYPTFV